MATPGPEPTVNDETLVKAIREAEYPATTAGEVAERVGLSRQRVRQRLEAMVGRDEIKRGKLRSGLVLYWQDD